MYFQCNDQDWQPETVLTDHLGWKIKELHIVPAKNSDGTHSSGSEKISKNFNYKPAQKR